MNDLIDISEPDPTFNCTSQQNFTLSGWATVRGYNQLAAMLKSVLPPETSRNLFCNEPKVAPITAQHYGSIKIYDNRRHDYWHNSSWNRTKQLSVVDITNLKLCRKNDTLFELVRMSRHNWFQIFIVFCRNILFKGRSRRTLWR